MQYPLIKTDLDKIRANSRLMTNLTRPYGIEVVGVTKGFCASVEIAQAMLDGGIKILADSRLQNLRRLRQELGGVRLMHLRIPMPSEVPDLVSVADYILISDAWIGELISKAALRLGKKQKVLLMIDLGDLREGVLPQNTFKVIEQLISLKGIELYGLGTNLTCYGAVIPTRELMEELVELATQARTRYGIELPVISGGNSSSLNLVLKKEMPAGITQLRLGESILLGVEAARRTAIPSAYSDAFTLYAEVIELLEKPSIPRGEIGLDAFGNRPVFEDRGIRRRAIVALGQHDIVVEKLKPLFPGVKILGASSDHMILDVSDADVNLSLGDIIPFSLEYGALIHGILSPYVDMVYDKNDSEKTKKILSGMNKINIKRPTA